MVETSPFQYTTSMSFTSCRHCYADIYDGRICSYCRSNECSNTLTDALVGNRGHDFAADAAGYACPACGNFMDFFADYFEGEDMNHCIGG